MGKVIEYTFVDNKGDLYLIETSEIFKKWDKIYDKDYKKDLIAT